MPVDRVQLHSQREDGLADYTISLIIVAVAIPPRLPLYLLDAAQPFNQSDHEIHHALDSLGLIADRKQILFECGVHR